MSQIAQQDHLFLTVSGVLDDQITDADKEELKRLYRAGTLLDVILEWGSQGDKNTAKVIGYKVESNELYVAVIEIHDTEQLCLIPVGSI